MLSNAESECLYSLLEIADYIVSKFIAGLVLIPTKKAGCHMLQFSMYLLHRLGNSCPEKLGTLRAGRSADVSCLLKSISKLINGVVVLSVGEKLERIG